MEIIPSIDLMYSKRVEVVSHEVETVFGESDPIEIALFWEKAGANMIHVVDIDAALDTGRRNTSIIEKIIRSVKIPVQVAGGIRDRNQVEEFLSAGAYRVVVRPRPCSTSFAKDFSGLKIVLGIDYLSKNRFRDLGKKSIIFGEEEVVSWVLKLSSSMGLNGVLVTDVGAEGSLNGVREEALGFLKKLGETGLEIMYAGGVSSVKDVLKLRDVGVEGVIIGKALYKGLLSFQELRRVIGG
ncbi:MAG: HisA/HisF-related TIM barrel protein [Crenarchaeota archaeon]|nr:HisA/HisF-related TIM barrel protein [Thermoproteota archaeon]MDW8033499.1 HisA/HisF-related TIM barrel protein [Nitrososphaerota archaeon]